MSRFARLRRWYWHRLRRYPYETCSLGCGRPVALGVGPVPLVWAAPHDLWNAIVGGPDATDDPGGCLCIPCFERRCQAAGIALLWTVVPLDTMLDRRWPPPERAA